LRFRNISQIF